MLQNKYLFKNQAYHTKKNYIIKKIKNSEEIPIDNSISYNKYKFNYRYTNNFN